MLKLLRKNHHPFLRVVVFSFLLLLMGCADQVESPHVINGKVDLSSWDFENDGPVRLFGEWQFSWNATGKAEDTLITDYYQVPALWQGVTANGQLLESKGNAVYTVRLRMPNAHSEKMAVLVAGGMSVCEIWINGTKMESSGQFGTEATTEEPNNHYVIAECPETWRVMEIALHISNYHNMQGGLNGDVLLGTAGQINSFYHTPRLVGVGMAGALCCLSLLYISLFVMRRSGKENLYFGFFCLFWCVAILFSPSSGFLMSILAPSIPWAWYINCSLLPYGMTVPLMLMFYHSFFPKRFGVIMERICWTLGLVYIVYILATPPNAYDKVLFFYFGFSSLALIYMFLCFAIDMYHQEKGVWILSIGYLALAVAELDDILFDLNIVNVASLRPLGMFFFILSYAFYMAFRFSSAFNRAESLAVELKATNCRLLQLDKMKDEFFANTTHELKTPLAGMIGIAESLQAGSNGSLSDSTRNHLNTIINSGRRLSKLINDVLDFSRLKHKDIELNNESVNLHDMVQQVLSLAKALKINDKVRLVNGVPSGFPSVIADPDRLEQILFNLIGNSVKYTDVGEVSVIADIAGDKAMISVADTGRGIPEEKQQLIFMPYEQADAGESGGTGIGLSITKQLVEMHGGDLRVTSDLGEGSTFSFALRLAESGEIEINTPVLLSDRAQVQEIHPFSPEIEAPPGRYQILVVDDEPVNIQVVASILDLAGISFRTAANGKTALRMVEGGDRPDMVLLDVMMPDMNGYQVCRELRRSFTPSVLPIVLLTVKNRVGDIVEGFSAGANDYLTKPFSREELSARVLSQLKLKDAYVALAENAELKHEIELRRKTESNLRFLHARLGKVLDSLDDVIVVVNQSCEIVFYNESLKDVMGCFDNDLLGQPLGILLKDASGNSSSKMLDYCSGRQKGAGQSALFEGIGVQTSQAMSGTSFWATRVELEEETLTLLMLRVAGSHEDSGMALPATIIQDLDDNRQRVLSLENAMLSADSSDPEKRQQLVDDIKSLDDLLGKISSRMQGSSKDEQRRSLAVKIMNLSIDCWVDATQLTKADLAEQSGLWNVYMERDGYFRTQTLDKYLEIETLPQKPRWKMVFVTADYVLANSQAAFPVRTELETTLASLKELISN
jgi:two-component system sensor histidine kinase ChiS